MGNGTTKVRINLMNRHDAEFAKSSAKINRHEICTCVGIMG